MSKKIITLFSSFYSFAHHDFVTEFIFSAFDFLEGRYIYVLNNFISFTDTHQIFAEK